MTTNPGVEVTWIGVLPQARAVAATRAATSGAVSSPETTSTRRITGAGLKKCMPATRSGWRSGAAIAETDSEEVFVARMQSAPSTFSRPPNSSRLISIDSAAASITSRLGARSARSAAGLSRAAAASASPRSIRPRSARLRRTDRLSRQKCAGADRPEGIVSELQVELVAADRRVWVGAATMVRCRTASGELGVMPGHTPLLGVLVNGDLVIHQTDGAKQSATIDSGFLSVEHDRVTIVADHVDVQG